MEDVLKHRMDIKKNILKSFQIDLEKSEENDIEKARHSIYADTPENRKLNRVGQEYGSKKQEESNENKYSSSKEESGKQGGKSLSEHAKNSDDETLKKVVDSKTASEELKNEANKELESRGKATKGTENK